MANRMMASLRDVSIQASEQRTLDTFLVCMFTTGEGYSSTGATPSSVPYVSIVSNRRKAG